MRPHLDPDQLGRLAHASDPRPVRSWENLTRTDQAAYRAIGEAVARKILDAAMGVRVSSDTEQRIEVQSGYGANSREPFVTLTLPPTEDGPGGRIQMPAAAAFDLGTNLIQGAEAALTDGVIVEFFTGQLGLGLDEVAPILTQLRAYRIRKSAEGT